jgi:hypothetical protein
MIKTEHISPKQLEILRFPYYDDYDALICDGAIRSGKTIWCGISFILWGMSKFKECNFAICGKTIASAVRNVVKPLLSIKYLKDNFTLHYSAKDSLLTITRGRTRITFTYLLVVMNHHSN